MRLAGAHAVVTGGGTGIGAAIARALAAEGAKLTLIGRRRETLEEVAQSIRSSRAQSDAAAGVKGLGTDEGVEVCTADVTDRAEIDVAFAAARAANGPITILINNAGAVENAPFARVTEDSWRAMMAVNVDALFHCCQAAFDDIVAAPAGRIVTIASTAGLRGYKYSAAYVSAKHGAVGMMRALALELAETNATANAVCPGFTDTKIIADAVAAIGARTGSDAKEARARLSAFNPQGRLVTPGEVADAVLFLCLPGSQSITGQALAVAGGEVM